MTVLLGNGTGGFAAALYSSGGMQPIWVAVGDYNGDQEPDLAIANQGSNNVSVLLGDGTGGFAAAANFAGGQAPLALAVGDFNGDKKPDLAVLNSPGNFVGILANQSR